MKIVLAGRIGVTMLLLTGAALVQASSPPGRYSDKPHNRSAIRTIEGTGGVSLKLRTIGQAHAIAPSDWQANSSPQGDAVDFRSPDGQIYAGWGVVAIKRAMQSYYGDLYGDPATSMRFVLTQQVHAMGDGSNVEFTSRPERFDADGYFQVRRFESQTHRGLVFYHLYPAYGGGPQDYIESIYVAVTEKNLWARKGRLAVNVAASIRGSVQLIPRPSTHHTGKSGDEPDTSTYNMQLGTEYCHSQSTGQNYLVDRTASWNDNGPDGPGYYRKVGNSYEKLVQGLSN